MSISAVLRHRITATATRTHLTASHIAPTTTRNFAQATRSDIPGLRPHAKPSTPLSDTQLQTLESYKQLERQQLELQTQRFYTDKTGLPPSQYRRAYRQVRTQNWLIASALVAFIAAVYGYSSYRIKTADDTFDSDEMKLILEELDEEVQQAQLELDGKETSAFDTVSGLQAANQQSGSGNSSSNNGSGASNGQSTTQPASLGLKRL